MALCRAIEDPAERVACYDAVLDADAGVTETTTQRPTPATTESVARPAQIPAAPAAATPTTPADRTSEAVAEPAAVPEPIAIPTTEPTTSQAPAPVTTPATATTPAPEPTSPAATQSDADFGLPAERPAKHITEISVPIDAVKRTPTGRLVLELANGQTWAQTDSRKLSVKPGDTVNIRAGLGGSFYLNKATGSRSLKVRRIN